MGARILRWLAWAAVLASLAAIGISLWAQRQAGALQGPQALAALPDGQVWLTVNDTFWQLDADGALQARISITALGLPDRGRLAAGAVANVVLWLGAALALFAIVQDLTIGKELHMKVYGFW